MKEIEQFKTEIVKYGTNLYAKKGKNHKLGDEVYVLNAAELEMYCKSRQDITPAIVKAINNNTSAILGKTVR